MYSRCVDCRKRKRDVRPRIDPYKWEIEGKKVRRNLCKSCESRLADEV